MYEHLDALVQSKGINVMQAPRTCTLLSSSLIFLPHPHRFPTLHLPMRSSLQTSAHHHIHPERQQGAGNGEMVSLTLLL